jgi:gamma-glutamylaminecyclotransferase
MNHNIFVYGTLREGYPNHHHNVGVRQTGTFRTVEKFPLVLNGQRNSPCLIYSPGEGYPVRGEVYRVNDEGLALMDKLERIEAPDGYQRRQISVTSETQLPLGEVTVYAYLKKADSVSDIRQGPLQEYTLEHASAYRSRKYIDRS